MPRWVQQLPPAPQVGRHCFGDPPCLRHRGESVRTHSIMTGIQGLPGSPRTCRTSEDVSPRGPKHYWDIGDVCFLLFKWLQDLCSTTFLDRFTYIINGGHQQQDDGGNVQDHDSSQNQHCGFRGKLKGKGKETHNYYISTHCYVIRDALIRTHTHTPWTESCLNQEKSTKKKKTLTKITSLPPASLHTTRQALTHTFLNVTELLSDRRLRPQSQTPILFDLFDLVLPIPLPCRALTQRLVFFHCFGPFLPRRKAQLFWAFPKWSLLRRFTHACTDIDTHTRTHKHTRTTVK